MLSLWGCFWQLLINYTSRHQVRQEKYPLHGLLLLILPIQHPYSPFLQPGKLPTWRLIQRQRSLQGLARGQEGEPVSYQSEHPKVPGQESLEVD